MGEFHSPYNGMGNNPVNLVDPTGGCTPAGNCMDNPRFLSSLGRQIMGTLLPAVTVSASLKTEPDKESPGAGDAEMERAS
jgi:hypothetical protein